MNSNLICSMLALLAGPTTFLSPLTAVSQTFSKTNAGNLTSDSGYFTACAWGDFDNDGNLDVIVANWNNRTNVFYRNNGNGTFTRLTTANLVADKGFHFGLAWGDFDNDGQLDLMALDGVGGSGDGKSVLYRNGGDGTFATVATGPSATERNYFAMGTWADYDRDGWLDFFSTVIPVSGQGRHNNLYHNNHDGSFSTIATGSVVTDQGFGAGCVWADYDSDGFPDLFVANQAADAVNFLYHNNGDGTLSRITNGVVALDRGTCSCAAWGDFDNDGFLDLFVAGFTESKNRLYRNRGDGSFDKVSSGPMLSNVAGSAIHAASWGDYDNDGYLDLFLANEFGSNALFHNNGDGTFSQVTTEPVTKDDGNKGAAAWVDYDNDGFLDLFVTRGGDSSLQTNLLYHNNGNSNHWIKVQCVGTVSNRSAIGAKVRVLATIGGRRFWQLREITGGGGWNSVPLLAHFGLGDAAKIELLRIEWPSGAVEELQNRPVDQSLTLVEPPRLSSAAVSGRIELSLQGWPGIRCDVDHSSDLVQWAPFATLAITNSAGVTVITNASAAGLDRQFYRAVLR